MSNPINAYSNNAQLSMAAYANLTEGMSEADYKDALIRMTNGNGFSDSQANAFVNRYSIVKVFKDTATDFFATLFENNDTHEKILAIRGTESSHDLLVTDAQIAFFHVVDQWTSLQQKYSDIVGQLQPNETLTVTRMRNGDRFIFR